MIILFANCQPDADRHVTLKKLKNKHMKLQILQDNTGKGTGVYVPIADWELIKRDYPDIELVENEIPQ